MQIANRSPQGLPAPYSGRSASTQLETKLGGKNSADSSSTSSLITEKESSSTASEMVDITSAAKAQSSKEVPPTPSGKIRQSQEKPSHTPRSYAMVVSSYENVARTNGLSHDSAKQFGVTLQHRVNDLSANTLRAIQDLPEYKKLSVDKIQELGETITDALTDEDDSLKAFALLKSSEFADLMEPKEAIHRSFADMMKDNGDEKLMFGALDLIDTMQSAKSPEKQQSVDIKA